MLDADIRADGMGQAARRVRMPHPSLDAALNPKLRA
jgi:hypothetical protein